MCLLDRTHHLHATLNSILLYIGAHKHNYCVYFGLSFNPTAHAHMPMPKNLLNEDINTIYLTIRRQTLCKPNIPIAVQYAYYAILMAFAEHISRQEPCLGITFPTKETM